MRLITGRSEQEGGGGEEPGASQSTEVEIGSSCINSQTPSTAPPPPLFLSPYHPFKHPDLPSAISEKIPHISCSPTGKISCTAPSKGRVASCNLLSAVDAHCNALQGGVGGRQSKCGEEEESCNALLHSLHLPHFELPFMSSLHQAVQVATLHLIRSILHNSIHSTFKSTLHLPSPLQLQLQLM